MKKNMLQEGHKDVVNMVVRCRIKIEDRDDPTVLDIMTDMRALPGIVTVRQTRPISDTVGSSLSSIFILHLTSILTKSLCLSKIKFFFITYFSFITY